MTTIVIAKTNLITEYEYFQSIVDENLNGVSKICKTPLLTPEFYQVSTPVMRHFQDIMHP